MPKGQTVFRSISLTRQPMIDPEGKRKHKHWPTAAGVNACHHRTKRWYGRCRDPIGWLRFGTIARRGPPNASQGVPLTRGDRETPPRDDLAVSWLACLYLGGAVIHLRDDTRFDGRGRTTSAIELCLNKDIAFDGTDDIPNQRR